MLDLVHPVRPDRIDFDGRSPDTGAMGVRTRGLDIKAGAAKLKADKAARRDAEPCGGLPRVSAYARPALIP
jgi:hypothetical protein